MFLEVLFNTYPSCVLNISEDEIRKHFKIKSESSHENYSGLPFLCAK